MPIIEDTTLMEKLLECSWKMNLIMQFNLALSAFGIALIFVIIFAIVWGNR